MKYRVSDICCIEIFKSFLKQSFPNINENNEYLVQKCYEVFLNTKSNRIRNKFDDISKYLKSLRCGKSSSVLSIDYWKSMGWENCEEIYKKISFEQRKRSPLCKEYYIDKDVSESEYTETIKKIQKERSDKMIKKYPYKERLKKCKWSKQYWIENGFSEDEATFQVHKLNGMCRENYKSDDEYESAIKKQSERQKELYRLNPEKYWKKNLGYESKEELYFFNEISKHLCGLKHLHLGINVQNTELYSKYGKQYVITYGYIEFENNIILFEYDGNFWHDIEYDEIRDDIILSKRKDIIGIIRIGDIYFKGNNIEKIIKDIEYAIEDIKSKKCKRKLLY